MYDKPLLTQEIEQIQFDYCGIFGSKTIATFTQEQASFLGVNLMPSSYIPKHLLAGGVISGQNGVTNFCEGWKML